MSVAGPANEADGAGVTVYGFPLSTFVNVVRLVLTHKSVPFAFCDLEAEMGGPRHLALHPFDRVPILEHGDFRVYETSAIALYVDEEFDGPALQPHDTRARARVRQWMSALCSYYYPYMAYHLGHERMIFPALGIAPDEKVVAAALPRIRLGLDVMERELEHGREFLVGDQFDAGGFLHASDADDAQPDRRRAGPAAIQAAHRRVASANGRLAQRCGSADGGHTPRRQARRACPQVGRNAPAEVLSMRSLLPQPDHSRG